jgi:hypothetical protein
MLFSPSFKVSICQSARIRRPKLFSNFDLSGTGLWVCQDENWKSFNVHKEDQEFPELGSTFTPPVVPAMLWTSKEFEERETCLVLKGVNNLRVLRRSLYLCCHQLERKCAGYFQFISPVTVDLVKVDSDAKKGQEISKFYRRWVIYITSNWLTFPKYGL